MLSFPRYVRLSLPRLWMREVVRFGNKFAIGLSASVRVSAVVEARRKHQPLISWSAILIKAMALTSRKWPELRRAYITFPWPHLYEHPHCVASVVVEREWHGERAVFFDQIPAPENQSLREIDRVVESLKDLPIENVGGYRRLLRITRYPWPLRRLMWLVALYGAGRMKSKYFGTVSINSIPSRHLRITQSATPVSVSFVYAPAGPDGRMPLQIFFDHRVTDGQNLHRVVADMEAILNRDIVDELNALSASP
jgi:hypothetical protein